LNSSCIISDEWLVRQRDRDHLICGDAKTVFHIWRKKDAASLGTFLRFGLFADLIATTPAGATIEKIMNQCNGKLCPFFRASIVIPDGWVEDRGATRHFNSQFLLPKGTDFETAAAKIYVAVKYNRKKQPISDFMPENIADWRSRAKDAKNYRS